MSRVMIPKATHMAIVNGGDGSAYALFFSSMEGAERYMEEDPERFCDDVLDISSGIQVDPERPEWVAFATEIENFIFPGSCESAYREDRILALTEHFECGRATIYDWADGTVIPLEGTREQAVMFIRRHHELASAEARP